MSQQQPNTPGHGMIDLNGISDPHVRRVLRTVCQQMSETIQRQQMQIEALLEMLIDKHVASLGEFKRHVVRVQQKAGGASYLHEAVNVPTPSPTATRVGTPPRSQPKVVHDAGDDSTIDDGDHPGGRRVYRL